MAGLAIARDLGTGHRAGAIHAASGAAQIGRVARTADGPDGYALLTLPRHGRRPLGVRARLLVEGCVGNAPDGEHGDAAAAGAAPVCPAVISRVALYETETGALVAAITHTPAHGELPGLSYAAAFEDADQLKAWLAAHDPALDLPALLQLPADLAPDAMAEAMAGSMREIGGIRARFQALVAALLAPAGSPGRRMISA